MHKEDRYDILCGLDEECPSFDRIDRRILRDFYVTDDCERDLTNPRNPYKIRTLMGVLWFPRGNYILRPGMAHPEMCANKLERRIRHAYD